MNPSSAEGLLYKLEGIIPDLEEYLDNHADVIDGEYGVPSPNTAMRLLSSVHEIEMIVRRMLASSEMED